MNADDTRDATSNVTTLADVAKRMEPHAAHMEIAYRRGYRDGWRKSLDSIDRKPARLSWSEAIDIARQFCVEEIRRWVAKAQYARDGKVESPPDLSLSGVSNRPAGQE